MRYELHEFIRSQTQFADTWRRLVRISAPRIMWIWFLGIAVLGHFSGCYASRLSSMRIIAQTGDYEACQLCILKTAGALYIEEYGEARITTSYMVMGLVDYIATNLIKCSTTRQCRGFVSKPISSKTRKGEQSISAPLNQFQTKAKTLLLSNVHAEHTNLMLSAKKSKALCLYRPENLHSSLCEACFKRKSDTGSMEKYAVYHLQMSEVYVIYTSDTEKFIESCHEFQICRGQTIVFKDDLCTIFRHRISPMKVQRETADTLPFVDEIANQFSIWSSESSRNHKPKVLEGRLRAILLDSYCISTTKAHHEQASCWSCLHKKFGGMVVLDRIKKFGHRDDKREFLVYLFAEAFSDKVKTKCDSPCGTIVSRDYCMLASVHTDNLTPTYDIFALMKRKEFAQQSSSVPNLISKCFLIQHSYGKESECRALFRENSVHKLSSLAFLVSLSGDTSGQFDSELPYIRAYQCTEVDLMPDTICQYESNRIKISTDLNLRFQGEYPSSSGSEYSETDFVEAKVILYKWTDIDANDDISLIECFECLTRKRSIVVLSVMKQYVWMVNYRMRFPKCPSCGENMKPGLQIPYNHNLRQIPAQDVHPSFGIVKADKKRRRGEEKGVTLRDAKIGRPSDDLRCLESAVKKLQK